ncbi:MAG: heat-inducible transcriptional repressor HrcA [Desulfovibrionaceae bacterium]
MTLSSREREVLVTIVEDYISTAQPVGSRTVAKKSALHLSPASMRNTMADLTDKGLLRQPHTSAGRVPTPDAFRYYLDTILTLHPLAGDRRKRIAADLTGAGLDLPGVLDQASRVLSTFSNHISLVLAPSREEVRWREIDFALVKKGLVLAVLIMDGGMVQNKLVEASPDVTVDDLRTFANFLNDHFAGRTLSEARKRIAQECRDACRNLEEIYRRALRLASEAVQAVESREVFVGGAGNLFGYAEFADVNRIRDILRLLDERTRLLGLLDKAIAGEGVKILLGQDVEGEELAECSVVSSRFGGETSTSGAVGIIGPLRMDYAAVVPMVDYIAKTLTSLLESRF